MNTYAKNKRSIVIVGYPKSGTTWITRLVAEVIGCSVKGFLASNHNEIAIEGLKRESNISCYKSHHQFYEIQKENITKKDIIYVIRDPRDVYLSGLRYFDFNNYHHSIKKTTFFQKLILMKALFFGSEKFNFWTKISWRKHYAQFSYNNCFFIRYEDMLDNPEEECERILSFLEIKQNKGHIKHAIKNQSFSIKKEFFLRNKDLKKANFMKIGKKGQWESHFSLFEKSIFWLFLRKDIKKLKYSRK